MTKPPNPLTERGLNNLVAFTRLLGYVRHFHPSDEAAAITDGCHRFAVEGVQSVEGATDSCDLAHRLSAHFRTVAPTLRVFLTGQRLPLPVELFPPANRQGLGVMMWRHEGYGAPRFARPYRSVRVRKSTPQGCIPKRLPDPRQPYRADLGGGVSCCVPLALWTDARGTLPHRAQQKRASTSEPREYLGDDRAVRLAAVALAWNVWQHFYPYFDVVKTDWRGVLRETLCAAATDYDATEFLSTLRRMNAQLQDGHGYVQRHADWRRYAPPFHMDWIEERLVITSVTPEGAGGLRPGDVVLRVDGQPATGALESQERLVSAATPGRRRFRAIQELLADTDESEMVLEIATATGQPQAVTVRRSVLCPSYWDLGFLQRESRPPKIVEMQPGLWYVDFCRTEDSEFYAVLSHLAQARGVLFDVRGYPSAISYHTLAHLIDAPITSPKHCLPTRLYPDRQRVEWDVRQWDPIFPVAPRIAGKIAFLTDERAVSWAETYLAFVEHYHLGEIVGAPTAGTNGALNEIEEIIGGYRLYWTCYRVLKHDGSPHHGIGLLPTIPVTRTLRGVAAGRDEVMERALEVVSARP